jgi:hypothetical protein
MEVIAALPSPPDKCGYMDVAVLSKRNMLFGGITWQRQFLAVCGAVLYTFRPTSRRKTFLRTQEGRNGFAIEGCYNLQACSVKVDYDDRLYFPPFLSL